MFYSTFFKISLILSSDLLLMSNTIQDYSLLVISPLFFFFFFFFFLFLISLAFLWPFSFFPFIFFLSFFLSFSFPSCTFLFSSRTPGREPPG